MQPDSIERFAESAPAQKTTAALLSLVQELLEDYRALGDFVAVS